jgi:hypothetical protein
MSGVGRPLLLFFKYRQKQILWKIDWLGTSGHVPDPILAAGNFNANQAPDLLFCYSTDRGIGKSAEHWTQYLYLFFDNEQTIEQPFSLAVVDIFLCDPDEEKLSSCKPSKDRLESLVMLLPAWGKNSRRCRLNTLNKRDCQKHYYTITRSGRTDFCRRTQFFRGCRITDRQRIHYGISKYAREVS